VIKQCVLKIISTVKERLNKLEEQEKNLNGMVEMKLHSFHHYLKNVGFKGYGKWLAVNQAIKELHPQGLSLMEIIVTGKQDIVY